LRLFSFGGYGLALAALALDVLGAIKCPPSRIEQHKRTRKTPYHKSTNVGYSIGVLLKKKGLSINGDTHKDIFDLK